ncbi:hypothetical protein D3C81_1204980 [compost metagenome]
MTWKAAVTLAVWMAASTISDGTMRVQRRPFAAQPLRCRTPCHRCDSSSPPSEPQQAIATTMRSCEEPPYTLLNRASAPQPASWKVQYQLILASSGGRCKGAFTA